MGCSSSKQNVIDFARGNEKDFHERFVEEEVLGQGEFGVVKQCMDLHARDGDDNKHLAVKILRKGITWKDNTLFMPIKPEALKLECGILKDLGGRHCILELIGVWESPSNLYMVTEQCDGGEMMQYVAKAHNEGIHTEDVSRIAMELISAVNHCNDHGVIHRDIKPENIMFQRSEPGSSLRLIDFGCACRDAPDPAVPNSQDPSRHTTFAGTPFYISPEMFQRNYTHKTDIWSVGITLYVLVAGYPVEQLQKAFNLLQSSDRNLRDLPGMPKDELPDSFFEMLHKMLTYKHKIRHSADQILPTEFIKLHNLSESAPTDEHLDTLGPLQPSGTGKKRPNLLVSTAYRHSAYLAYETFERSVTALLAAVLLRTHLDELVKKLSKPVVDDQSQDTSSNSDTANKMRLQVIQVQQLKKALQEINQTECAEMINNLPNAASYDGYAYHWKLLMQFTEEQSNKTSSYARQAELDNSMGRRTRSLLTLRKAQKDALDLSDHGGQHAANAQRKRQNNLQDNSSVHGSSMFDGLKRKKRNAKKKDVLNSSSHF
uniref:Protein kinase domain-containing protein n=1 Tax=Eucampia antarctica TaxID=49252 RepID=A0A7S2R6Z7_9STRA|mmetsp:Transcript_18060/g.17414  ORF Transcript_18060/g.17414 Transcript_18060/m.17414 type:complete len:544 (+) Transcript_18060:41-1672(+)